MRRGFVLVLGSIGALVVATTLEGELEFVNQPVLDYFGKTIEQLKGWRASGDILHPDDLASAIAVWRESIEKGVPHDLDHRFRRSDGVYRWFQARGRPQRDARGSIIRWYALLTDIDERKRAETKSTYPRTRYAMCQGLPSQPCRQGGRAQRCVYALAREA